MCCVLISSYLTSTVISILSTHNISLFYFCPRCLSVIIHSWLVPSFLIPLFSHLPYPVLLFPGQPPALTQPPFTRPPRLFPLPFLTQPPPWLPLPHPRLLPQPSLGHGLLGPSPAQSVFPISFCGGAPTATGTGQWGRGRERFGLIWLLPPPTTICPLRLPQLQA